VPVALPTPPLPTSVPPPTKKNVAARTQRVCFYLLSYFSMLTIVEILSILVLIILFTLNIDKNVYLKSKKNICSNINF